ncbi:sarcolemmal membrane-associated protein isoform X8 [Octopus vulgaris]|uniref:Sarcolemmal membrane-associated protein n=1 Tax=Octopus vulgaris TaxID=6645 RepID=A0AA36FC67_OCTVU|nr:sarcolemmal membrane-associated protein isoform X8 [Octopus vulgaris]
MSAVAILTCTPNSHPFLARHITLHEPVKVGRSVARARPSPSNGTFDCKVLSRNHAILWYKNGKFDLQDTKSSNGTFVNNKRLTMGSDENPSREIFSGDIIQFGVEVMENNRRGEKITHGCIIATVTLFHPDGREAKPTYSNTILNNPSITAPSAPGITIESQEFYQLAQYLQEALLREQMLERKLSTLQTLVQHTQKASENGWQALIDEDRLLSRLEVLESQLVIYSKNHGEDTLRQELVALQDDKHHYEITAKESLRRVLQEKLEAVRKITDLEQSLGNAENNCCYLKEITERTQNDLKQLAADHQEQRKEVEQLQKKLEEAKKKHQEELEKVENEKQELIDKLEEVTKQEKILCAKVESLQADNDITNEQLAVMKTKWENIKEGEVDKIISNDDDSTNIIDKNKLGEQNVEIIPISKMDQESEDLQEKLQDTQQLIINYKAKIEELESKVKSSQQEVDKIQSDLDQANRDCNKYLLEIAALEMQLKEAHRQTECSSDLNTHLEAEIEELESEWTLQQSEKIDHDDEKYEPVDSLTLTSPYQISNHLDSEKPHLIDVEKLKALEQKRMIEATRDVKQQILDLRDQLDVEKSKHKETFDELIEKKRLLQEALQSAKQSRNEAEQLKNKVKTLQDEIDTDKNTRQRDSPHVKSSHESTHRPTAKNKSELNSLKEECTNLRKRIHAIETEMKLSRKENLQLSSDYNKLQDSHRELEALKVKLEHKAILWKSNMTDAQKEAEQAKQEVSVNPAMTSLSPIPPTTTTTITTTTISSPSCSAYTTTTSTTTTTTTTATTTAAAAVTAVSGKLDQQGIGHSPDRLSSDQLPAQTGQTKDLVSDLTVKCDKYTDEVRSLREELSSMLEDYQYLRDKSKLLSFISSIPLLILLFAILIAFYPTLEEITATSSELNWLDPDTAA